MNHLADGQQNGSRASNIYGINGANIYGINGANRSVDFKFGYSGKVGFFSAFPFFACVAAG